MCLAYAILTRSRHPFLIHLVRKENLLYRVNFSFMVGLVLVPLPVGYQLGVVGLAMGHLLVRAGVGYRSDVVE
jgi:hypothetical protein